MGGLNSDDRKALEAPLRQHRRNGAGSRAVRRGRAVPAGGGAAGGRRLRLTAERWGSPARGRAREEALRLMPPSLDLDMVRRVLGRTSPSRVAPSIRSTRRT
jgi:hypothetical protein